MAAPIPDEMVSALEAGREAYVAVSTGGGPHVTPTLYAWSEERVWFAAATPTLKAKVLTDRDRVGFLVRGAGRTVVGSGTVVVLDPRRPADLVGHIGLGGAAGLAAGRYLARNIPDLLAFGRDAISGRLGFKPPPLRVVYALTLDRVATVENDCVREVWGAWSHTTDRGAAETDVPAGGESAVAAVPGPFALPARWFADDQRLFVAPDVIQLVEPADTFDLSVCVDEYTEPGPAAKQGHVLRGSGRSSPGGWVEVDVERRVDWDGIETVAVDQ